MKAIKKYKHVVLGETIVITIHGQRRKCEELLKVLDRKMVRARVWREVQ